MHQIGTQNLPSRSGMRIPHGVMPPGNIIYLSPCRPEEAVWVPAAAAGNFIAVREEKVHAHQLSCNFNYSFFITSEESETLELENAHQKIQCGFNLSWVASVIFPSQSSTQ